MYYSFDEINSFFSHVKMFNILLNFQSLHFKYVIRIDRNSICSFIMRGFNDSFLGCHPLNVYYLERKKTWGLKNIRFLATSVKSLENNQLNCKKETKNDNFLIYYGSLSHKVKGVKVFTCVSSLGGIMIQPWMLQNILSGSNKPLGVALFSCVGFFTFVTPLLIHLLTKKYVTEIWYNSTTDTYTAIVLSFFLRKIYINFKIEDVKVPSVLPIFSTMYIKGRPVFIISDSFLEVEHYIKMMGYDKPITANPNNEKL